MDALFAVTLPSSVTKNETAVSVSVCVGKDLRVSVDPINSRDGVNEFEKRPFYFYTGANVGSKGLKGFVVNGKVGKDMVWNFVSAFKCQHRIYLVMC